MSKILKIIGLGGLLLLSAGARGQDIPQVLDNVRNDFNLVGMAAAVRCGGEETLTYYGGLRNLSTQAPVDANTLFRVASISKAFTAVGLMRLYELGTFSLDEDVSDALGYTLRNPNFPNEPITYRMLLSHTSGVNDGSGYSDFLGATVSTDNPPSIAEALIPGGSFYTSNMWRTELPGTHFAYSNLAYGLIGTLIEALSGQRFDAYMINHILQPLGIAGSYNVADLPNINDLAVLYRNSIPQVDNFLGQAPAPFNNPNYVPGTNASRFGPQGGLRTNLEGLLAFGNMLLNHGMHQGQPFLDSATVSLMLTPQWTFNGSNGDNYFGLFNSWGLGIHRLLGIEGSGSGDAIVAGETFYGHAGEAYGLLSDLYFHPESGYLIAFITNGLSSGSSYALGEQTTWYLVEEAVFHALTGTSWESCVLGLSANAPFAYDSRCEGITKFTGVNEVPLSRGESIEIYSMQGQLLWSKTSERSATFLAPLRGPVLIRLANGSGTTRGCVRKLYLN